MVVGPSVRVTPGPGDAARPACDTLPGVPSVLLLHPSDELYGSDRMVAAVVTALRGRYSCTVVLPRDGALGALVRAAGAEVVVEPLPVLRKALLTPRGLAGFLAGAPGAVLRIVRLVRRVRPDVCYVNTVTIPLALLACRLAGRPVVCHVHEAERDAPAAVALALTAPLLLARRVVAISAAAADFAAGRLPVLRRRTTVVLNAVEPPGVPDPLPAERPRPLRLLQIGRWSERKGTDVAVAALAEARQRGVDAELDVVGGAFPGYEWFEERIREQARTLGVVDEVRFRPFVDDPAPVYAATHVVVVASRTEPFGLVAVEGMLHGRVVLGSDVDGLAEVLADAPASWRFPPGSASGLADRIVEVHGDWERAAAEASRARAVALRRFGPDRFSRELLAVLDGVLARSG